MTNTGEPCASCGRALEGAFCPSCGERRLGDGDFSAWSFVSDSIAGLFNLDNRVGRTLASLVWRPGFLTQEYLAGRRVAYFRPFQLFLVANVVYFLIQPLTGFTGYNTPLMSHLEQQPYSLVLDLGAVAERAAEARSESLEVFSQAFDRRTETLARTLVILLVPLFSPWVALLVPRTWRGGIGPITFSTHYIAWHLVFLLTLALPALWWVSGWTGLALSTRGVLIELSAAVAGAAYLFFSVSRVGSATVTRSILSTVGLFAAFMLSTYLYRFVLFWAVLWTV